MNISRYTNATQILPAVEYNVTDGLATVHLVYNKFYWNYWQPRIAIGNRSSIKNFIILSVTAVTSAKITTVTAFWNFINEPKKTMLHVPTEKERTQTMPHSNPPFSSHTRTRPCTQPYWSSSSKKLIIQTSLQSRKLFLTSYKKASNEQPTKSKISDKTQSRPEPKENPARREFEK